MPDEKDRFLENVDEVVKRSQQLLVHDGLIAGKSLAAISRESGISEYVLKQRKKEVATMLTEAFYDEREYALAKAGARLERIYAAAEGWAFGTEGRKKDDDPVIPDRQWMKFLLDVIDRQVKLATGFDTPEQADQTLNFTKIEHLTITSGSDMFEFAKNSMWMEYNEYTPEQLQNILLEEAEVEQEVDLTQPLKLKQRIDQLADVINLDGEDDDADDR